ncbi:Txe/YoeB family addiction module toxin [Chryseobacterium sp. SC28]|uniref:Txe/YoeB family addiction module toxin n=1 Tax=Chryseobacterium sp. SC28 TaxID=2268028 RepID=UPI000F653889|nr:Txe/YoeB family addiction module toxin [Chryseobacterium sp. SC28]RRQ46481.1 Txe/YoeB family addiction module toxin [Chryseobacterium sp. SC28]
MSFSLNYTDKFLDDLKKHKKTGQKQSLSKVERLVTECLENPKTGTGKPEQLKHRKTETWSREINRQHRLVYEIESDDILFLSAWGHYDDK